MTRVKSESLFSNRCYKQYDAPRRGAVADLIRDLRFFYGRIPHTVYDYPCRNAYYYGSTVGLWRISKCVKNNGMEACVWAAEGAE